MPTIFDLGTKSAEKTKPTGMHRTIFDIEEKPRRTIFDIEKKTIPSVPPIIETAIKPTPPKTFIDKIVEKITSMVKKTATAPIAPLVSETAKKITTYQFGGLTEWAKGYKRLWEIPENMSLTEYWKSPEYDNRVKEMSLLESQLSSEGRNPIDTLQTVGIIGYVASLAIVGAQALPALSAYLKTSKPFNWFSRHFLVKERGLVPHALKPETGETTEAFFRRLLDNKTTVTTSANSMRPELRKKYYEFLFNIGKAQAKPRVMLKPEVPVVPVTVVPPAVVAKKTIFDIGKPEVIPSVAMPTPEVKPIPLGLEPLAEEARKYKSAEEFVKKQLTYEKKYDIIDKRRLTRYEQEQKQRETKGVISESRIDWSVSPQSKGLQYFSNLKETYTTHSFGKSVEVKEPQFYTNPTTKLYLSSDYSAGVAVTPEGDLVSVFKKSGSKQDINPILAQASDYAVSLDAFDINGKLQDLYSSHGFRPVARLKFNKEFAPLDWDFNKLGEPDIVFMVRDVEGITGLLKIPSQVEGGYISIKNKIPLFENYDDLINAKKAILKKIKTREAQLTDFYNQAIKEVKPPRLVEEKPLTPGKIKPLIHRIVGLKKVNDLLKLKKRTYLRQLYRAETKGAEIGYKFGRKELRQAIRDRNEASGLIGKLNSYIKVKLDLDYEDQLHGLLGQYDLTKRQTKTLKEREGTREFIKRMEEEGEMIYIPEDTLKRVDQIPLNDMSLDDLRALHEQAKDIVHFGKLKKQLIARKEIRDFGAVKQKLIRNIRQNFPKAKEEIPERPLTPSERKPKTLRGRVRKGIADGFDAYFAMHKKAEAIIESLDGYKELGEAWQETFNPIAKSEDKETLLGFRLQNIIRKTFERSGIDFVKTSLLQDTIEGSDLTKEEQIGVFVNSLNPDNRDGLRAFGWSDEKIDKIVDNLTPREKQFGRNLMRLAGAQRQRLFGIGEKLLGRRIKPVKGYWPKVYDYELNEAVALKERESDLFRDVIAKAFVERGFLKSRVKVKRPISLEIFKVFADHIDKTTHFITHALEIRDVQKLIYDPDIKAEIMRAVGKEEYKQLPAWLKYVANPEITSFNWWDKAAGRLRHNTTMAMLGVKVAVGLKQGGSFTMTINRIGVKNAVKGLVAFWKNPIKAQKFIYEKSPSMKFRRNKFDRELKDYFEKLGDKWGTENKRRFFFTIITNVDKITTLPSWLGAYTKGMNKYKGDEKSGILYADMIARRTQPAASPKDLPAIQRGTNMHKIFTMFYTHFTNVYQETARTTGMLTKKKIGIYEATVSYWWLLIAPAIYSMYVSRPSNLRRLIKGEYEETAKNTLKSIIGYGFASFPIVGTVVNSMLNPRYDYLPSPVFALPKEIIKIPTGKKLATKAKAATKAIGYLFGLPTPQMIITGTGISDLLKGETSNPFRLFLSKWALEDEESKIRKLPKFKKLGR